MKQKLSKINKIRTEKETIMTKNNYAQEEKSQEDYHKIV